MNQWHQHFLGVKSFYLFIQNHQNAQYTMKICIHIDYHSGCSEARTHASANFGQSLTSIKIEQMFDKVRIRTWDHSLKVQSANHYTMGELDFKHK